MSFVKEWIYRLRHNRGFGVQSPAAFYLVTHVLREPRHSYYIYPKINSLSRIGGCSSRHCRRLFRLVNAIQPSNIFILDARCGAAACAVAAGSVNVPCEAAANVPTDVVKRFMERYTGCRILQDNSLQTMDKFLEQNEKIGLLYIGDIQHCDKAVEKAIAHANRHTVIIVEGIRRNKEMKKWWKGIVASRSTVVTMDFYRWGALFFDTEYKKQHYTFWFE